MNFVVFNLAFKKMIRSLYCWLLTIVPAVCFFLINYGVLNVLVKTKKSMPQIDPGLKLVLRTFYMIVLVNILNIVIANLANFTVDKGNLIFILSKHYKRSTCLCAKVLALFVFLLFLELFLILFTFLLNHCVKQKIGANLWTNEELFKNCYGQIFLYAIYCVLFWPMISLYCNNKSFKLITSFSQIFYTIIYAGIGEILEKILNKSIDVDYELFVKEIFLHNVFFCPLSFVTFIMGICCFHRMDLRI